MALSELLSPLSILRHLREDGSAATLNRLMTSRHVADLRMLFSLSLYAIVLSFVAAIVFEGFHIYWESAVGAPVRPHGFTAWAKLIADAIVDSGPFVSVVLALGGTVMGWTYQSGSARLGVVDLFACEVTTLCRVFTIVDLTRRYVEAFKADLAPERTGACSAGRLAVQPAVHSVGRSGAHSGAAFSTQLPARASARASDHAPDQELIARIRRSFDHYASAESYTPVFDQNASDLRALDTGVVTNVTAFYTYLKAMKDSLRNLARIRAPVAAGDSHDAWHDALANVLYMQFLAFESARKAVGELIEFEPNQVENTVTILISEICAYCFLLQQFGTDGAEPGNTDEDFRHARLRIRRPAYRRIVGEAFWRAKRGERYWVEQVNDLETELKQELSDAPLVARPEITRRAEARLARLRAKIQQWNKAAETANELVNRYGELFPGETLKCPDDLPEAPADSIDGPRRRHARTPRRPSDATDGPHRRQWGVAAGE